MPSVAVIIIGDEILGGKFADENGPYLIHRLRTLGADLGRLVVIGDGVQDIAHEVRWCAERFDRVVTTGGVGPTHDDRTLEGVALAFGRPLERRAELVALLEDFGMQLNDAALRMATIPAGAELVDTNTSSYPVLRVDNVFVLPGVPRLMQAKFEGLAQHFRGPAILTHRLFVDAHETAIAHHLHGAAETWSTVAIGSYPRFGEGPFKVIVTFESREAGDLAACVAWLSQRLPLVEPAS